MNRTVGLVFGILAVVVGFVGLSSVYTVHQAEQALLLQFGKVVAQVKDPGLHFKYPFVQNVVFFDKRVLDFDNPAAEVPTLDQKQLVVDAFARYRIVDPLLFYQTVGNERGMQARLSTIINTSLRNVFGAVPLALIMTDKRADLLVDTAAKVRKQGEPFGIEVLDVRIKRVDLPEENSQAIFRRMQTQREAEARRIRAVGERDAKRIRAEADKGVRILIAEANKQSEILRGEGDGLAQEIYNKAYGQDPDFFDFYVSMRAYKEGLGGDKTRYIGPPEGDFFRFFRSMNPSSK